MGYLLSLPFALHVSIVSWAWGGPGSVKRSGGRPYLALKSGRQEGLNWSAVMGYSGKNAPHFRIFISPRLRPHSVPRSPAWPAKRESSPLLLPSPPLPRPPRPASHNIIPARPQLLSCPFPSRPRVPNPPFAFVTRPHPRLLHHSQGRTGERRPDQVVAGGAVERARILILRRRRPPEVHRQVCQVRRAHPNRRLHQLTSPPAHQHCWEQQPDTYEGPEEEKLSSSF